MLWYYYCRGYGVQETVREAKAILGEGWGKKLKAEKVKMKDMETPK